MAFLETVAVLGAAKFGQKVLESVAGTVAQKVAKGFTDQLSKPFEVIPIEKAIAASFRKAEEEVDLFYPAEQGRVEGFLKDFFSKRLSLKKSKVSRIRRSLHRKIEQMG